VKTHSIFLQAAGDDSVSDPIGKDNHHHHHRDICALPFWRFARKCITKTKRYYFSKNSPHLFFFFFFF
jgi:hypothetical protein